MNFKFNFLKHSYNNYQIKNPQKKSQFAMEFLNRIISHADLNHSETQRLIEYLWDVAKNQPKTKLQVFILY